MNITLIRVLTFVVLLLFSFDAYSQNDTVRNRLNFFQHFKSHYLFSNDTVVKKGIKFRVTNFAVQINVGAAKYLNDSKTEKCFGNYWNEPVEGFLYYKNYFFGGTSSSSTINVKDTLYLKGEKLNKDQPLRIFRSGIFIGYDINLPHKFSIAPYGGMVTTSFFPEHSDNNFYSPGFSLGCFLNKLIPLRPRRYLVIFVNGNFNQVNYSKFSSSLGNNFYSVSFGVGYKAWFLKKIKE